MNWRYLWSKINENWIPRNALQSDLRLAHGCLLHILIDIIIIVIIWTKQKKLNVFYFTLCHQIKVKNWSALRLLKYKIVIRLATVIHTQKCFIQQLKVMWKIYKYHRLSSLFKFFFHKNLYRISSGGVEIGPVDIVLFHYSLVLEFRK